MRLRNRGTRRRHTSGLPFNHDINTPSTSLNRDEHGRVGISRSTRRERESRDLLLACSKIEGGEGFTSPTISYAIS